jgi:hypothetical protein
MISTIFHSVKCISRGIEQEIGQSFHRHPGKIILVAKSEMIVKEDFNARANIPSRMDSG